MFLLSDLAGFMTGQTLIVDGGTNARFPHSGPKPFDNAARHCPSLTAHDGASPSSSGTSARAAATDFSAARRRP